MVKRKQMIHDTLLMKKAVCEVQRGKSAYSISKKYGIPQSTLKDHARGKYVDRDTSFGPPGKLDQHSEAALVRYITYMAERGFPLSKQQDKQLAKEVACKSSNDKVQSKVPSVIRNWPYESHTPWINHEHHSHKSR